MSVKSTWGPTLVEPHSVLVREYLTLVAQQFPAILSVAQAAGPL